VGLFSFLAAGVLVTVVMLCTVRASASEPNARGQDARSAAMAAMGKKIFYDPSLSASGTMACATCHNPSFAYGPPNGLPVQYGGPHRKSPGFRAVPSLRYTLNYVPVWSHAMATNPIERLTETNEVPAGGYTWDGRYNSLHAQAMLPLFSPVEMDNRDAETLAGKLSRAPYAGDFRTLFGAQVFERPALAVREATRALQAFELQDPSFHPYSSKFDRWLDGKAKLTVQELHGKQLFDDPNGGNCASCHLDEVGANGAHPLFTDFQFEAVGVPRNAAIPWNRDSHYYDMGLCGPYRTDAASHNPSYCGLFRTPSLRNAAMRHVFFHNGAFHSLREVLEFYVERDTDPEKWYPRGKDGKVEKFNDLPARYRANVDTTDAPLDRKRGEAPVWNERQIDDVLAFLQTLVDQDVVQREAGASALSHR
jgi:cytochrome c peroxidase